MKLQYNAHLDYQERAVVAVVDLFRGQTTMKSNFTIAGNASERAGARITDNGIGNRLELDEEDILNNLQDVQLRNGLAQTTSLIRDKYDFDIEMETGTGKTYVYLRTILELHKEYGFTKFIIVVPSIAIKEGVNKSLEITHDHFRSLYAGTIYEHFVYDSTKPDQVRSFAVNDYINIMVINIDAFRRSFDDPAAEKKANIIHRRIDKLNGMKPIELIAEANPVVIIDEPQSVDTTPKSKEAIASLNPLCTLRYSATHVDKHNLVYKLDAVDSFNMGLVKQIEVASFISQDYHNSAYMLLKSVDIKHSPITAKIELDVNVGGTIKRKTETIKRGDDLSEVTRGREVYRDYIVDEIYCEKNNEYVSFTSKSDILRIGSAIGDIDEISIKEQQIRKTIQEHLDKEMVLNPKGIKVLSLFFIDRVANYRYYDECGESHKGIYAELFEKHYIDLINKPKYAGLNIEHNATNVHNGYFAIDKKVKRADGSEETIFKETRGDEGKTEADGAAYTLIMQDKEKLLTFYDPNNPERGSNLRFIFSHSALREGWDNPNVFQICTLNETRSDVKKRQEIGRGLRLCVNQDGERLHGFDVNTLTVMANERYEDFAAALQKEYECDEGIRFGVIEKHTFANIPVKQPDGGYAYLGTKKSEAVFSAFIKYGYVDSIGRVQDKLKEDLKTGTLSVPDDVAACKDDIAAICRRVSAKLNIKPADAKHTINLNKAVFLSSDFKELWDRIKFKTTYAVNFNSKELINQCCEHIVHDIEISSAKLVFTKAKVDVTEAGVETVEIIHTMVMAPEIKESLPDIITYLQNRTSLTRKTIVEILVKSKTLSLFKKNPQHYMEEVTNIIISVMRLMIVDGIKYTKLGYNEFYAQELFETKELTGYLERNMVSADKSLYDYVIYDSDVERSFVEYFEKNESVKLYAKLPTWFKVPTPIGTYNPDWAVLIENDGESKLYFVLETKARKEFDSIRPTEEAKIKCGLKHFEALGTEVVFKKADNFNKFLNNCDI